MSTYLSNDLSSRFGDYRPDTPIVDLAKITKTLSDISTSSTDVSQLCSNLCTEIQNLSTSLSLDIDKLCVDLSSDISTLSTKINNKIYIEDRICSWISSNSELSIVKLPREEYELSVAFDADLCSNTLYVLDSDYIDAYGQNIKNVADPIDLSDAVSKKYVSEQIQQLGDMSLRDLTSIVGDNLAIQQNGGINKLSSYAPTHTNQLVNDSGFLTEHQPLAYQLREIDVVENSVILLNRTINIVNVDSGDSHVNVVFPDKENGYARDFTMNLTYKSGQFDWPDVEIAGDKLEFSANSNYLISFTEIGTKNNKDLFYIKNIDI